MDESEQIYEFSQDKLQNKNCNSSTTSNRHVEFINGQPIDNMQKSQNVSEQKISFDMKCSNIYIQYNGIYLAILSDI